MSTIYELKRYHHKKAWRKGDLESETIQDYSNTFSTRKAANEFLISEENKYKKYNYITRSELVKHGDGNSKLLVFTGEKWIHENTGSKEEEYYHYVVSKKSI